MRRRFFTIYFQISRLEWLTTLDSRTNYKENKNIDIETLYRYFTHRHRLGRIDVKNIDNRKQTSMFSMFRHRCPITNLSIRSFIIPPIPKAKPHFWKWLFLNLISDIDNVDLVMGKVMDQGPVLIISFQSQQIMCVRDAKNNVVEGDPEKVMRVNYVWVLCRDPTELNANAAWRLLDLSANSSEQLM